MKPWRDAHVIAVLWVIVAVLAVAWVDGLVTEHRERTDWAYVVTPPKPVPASACFSAVKGAWCP